MTFLGLCPFCLCDYACLQYLSESLQETDDKFQCFEEGLIKVWAGEM